MTVLKGGSTGNERKRIESDSDPAHNRAGSSSAAKLVCEGIQTQDLRDETGVEMKQTSKVALLIVLAMTIAAIVLAVWGAWTGNLRASKLFLTASTLAGLAAAMQLDVTGFFGRLFDEYSDTKKYPFGPPSRINREITDHPDWQLLSRLRDTLFYDTRLAFWLAMLSFALSLIGIWLG